VEIMITVTIIVILSSTVAISISSYVHERKGEEKVIAFYNELKLLKSFAMRDNARYLVKLNEGVNPAFEIYKDVDSLNGIPHNKYE
jgi:type II secretory pathway pseudopilin PulG